MDYLRFENISIKSYKHEGRFEIIINAQYIPLNHEFVIDQEKKISSLSGVDSMFIYGINEVYTKKLSFSVNKDVCQSHNISFFEPIMYVDSIMTLSPPSDKFNTLDTLIYKGIPINALLTISLRSENYKPQLFKSTVKENKVSDYDIMLEVYCSYHQKDKLIEELSAYFESLKKDMGYDFSVRIE